jgi:hypothetical protein
MIRQRKLKILIEAEKHLLDLQKPWLAFGHAMQGYEEAGGIRLTIERGSDRRND